MPASGEETLHAVGGVRFGAFRCPPGDWRWRETNTVGAEAYLVLPKVPVRIEQDGRQSVLATAAAAVFYAPDRQFRRTQVDPEGDRCLFVAIGGDVPRFGRTQAPLDGQLFALGVGLERAAAAGAPRLALDEGVCDLHAALLARASSPIAVRSRAATRRQHRELAEAAKAVLAGRVRENLALDALGDALAVSPFHLCRVFRAETGYSLHGFQTALRLRMALDRLDGYQGDLARLAVDLGFSHHSHLTRSFRHAFGLPPSAWSRRMVTAPALLRP